MDEDQSGSRIGQAKEAQYLRPGQENHLTRHENTECHDAEQDLGARETPFRQDVAVDSADGRRNNGGRYDHRHRIIKEGVDSFTRAADTEFAPSLYPVIEGKGVRHADKAVAADIAEIAERIE